MAIYKPNVTTVDGTTDFFNGFYVISNSGVLGKIIGLDALTDTFMLDTDDGDAYVSCSELDFYDPEPVFKEGDLVKIIEQPQEIQDNVVGLVGTLGTKINSLGKPYAIRYFYPGDHNQSSLYVSEGCIDHHKEYTPSDYLALSQYALRSGRMELANLYSNNAAVALGIKSLV